MNLVWHRDYSKSFYCTRFFLLNSIKYHIDHKRLPARLARQSYLFWHPSDMFKLNARSLLDLMLLKGD
jgi:hypothetical protein